MNKADVYVSVLAVVQNQASILAEFLRETLGILEQNYSNYEILIVDNASTDDTPTVVKKLLEQHRCVRYLRLSRELETELAITAGLDATIGDFVVNIHPEFDPPALTPTLVALCRNGSEVVVGLDRTQSKVSWPYRMMRSIFISLARRLVHAEIRTGTTGLRVLSRAAVNSLARVRKRKRHFPVLVTEVGLNLTFYPYDRVSRTGRPATISTRHNIRYGLSLLVHHTILPLRLASLLGLVGSAISAIYSVYVLLTYLFKSDVLPGWTTLSLQISGLFFFVCIILALIGEYLGRVLEEVSDRPLYHIREESSSAVMIAEMSQGNVLNSATLPEPTAPTSEGDRL